MNNFKLYTILLIGLVLYSCQKEIDIDLNEANPRLVIEANYHANDSSVTVIVSETSNYFDNSTSPFITNAIVTIDDAAGNNTVIPHVGNGKYTLSGYAPQYESSYTMKVVHNGVTYTAICRLDPPVQLYPIEYEYQPPFFGLDDGYVAYAIFQDSLNYLNNYRMVFTLNGERMDGLEEIFIQDDLLTDGNLVARPLFGSEFFQLNDTVILELQSIDQKVYDYYYQAIELSSSGGGGASAAPGNPIGNWSNDALGYFSAYSSSSQEVIIVE